MATTAAAEPAWLAARREAARERYGALPVPSNRDEAWRFTNLRGFDPDAYPVAAPETAEPAAAEVVPRGDVAGRIVQRGALVVSEELHADGVRFESLARSLADAPELVERHLGSVVGEGEKFSAGNMALWRDGVFLHVGRGVEVELPLRATVELAGADTALPYRALVVLEPGARATFIEEFSSEAPGYVNAVVELVIGDGAKLEYVTVQNHHSGTRQFGTHRATVGRDAEIDWVALGLGGERAKSRMESYLGGRGAVVRVTGAYFLTGTEHIDYDTTQEHAAPDTTSDLFFKGALRDRSSAVWRGVIRVDRGAQKTDAFQENRNLLLSPRARANSIPGLEIEANDVRCTHAATAGRIDRMQLFYLMSRGLSRAEAERLIVRGFFQPVLDRVASNEVRDALAAALESRLPT